MDDLKRLEALEIERGPGAPTPPTWPTEIQELHFPSRKGGYSAYVSNPLEIDKLAKPKRRLLELLCRADLGENWAHAGMPPDIRSRRRLLGLDPRSLMEDRIPCAKLGKGKHPRWKVLETARRPGSPRTTSSSRRSTKMGGKKFKSPKTFFAWTVDGIDIIRWRIALATARKQPVFDLWLFPFDDGGVFAAGSDKPTIAMSQNRFLAEGKKPRPDI